MRYGKMHCPTPWPEHALRCVMVTPLQRSVCFKLAPRPGKNSAESKVAKKGQRFRHFSPRVGCLAVARVFRSLGMPEAVAARLGLYLKGSENYPPGYPNQQPVRRLNSIMAEALLLLQSCGLDVLLDTQLLQNDRCLRECLGHLPPGVGLADGG